MYNKLQKGIYRYRGEPLALLDLAWPDGLQVGLSEPVAMLIDEDSETEEIANQAGLPPGRISTLPRAASSQTAISRLSAGLSV